MRWVTGCGGAVVAAMVVACGGGAGTSGTWRAPERIPANKVVDADSLSRAAEQNEVRFEENYAGKYLAIEGGVEKVTDNPYGEKVVILCVSPGSRPVHCRFQSGVSVSKLNRYDAVRIVGVCEGLVIGTIQFRDCYFWEAETQPDPEPAKKGATPKKK